MLFCQKLAFMAFRTKLLIIGNYRKWHFQTILTTSYFGSLQGCSVRRNIENSFYQNISFEDYSEMCWIAHFTLINTHTLNFTQLLLWNISIWTSNFNPMKTFEPTVHRSIKDYGDDQFCYKNFSPRFNLRFVTDVIMLCLGFAYIIPLF
jgi:hypothetical protein